MRIQFYFISYFDENISTTIFGRGRKIKKNYNINMGKSPIIS